MRCVRVLLTTVGILIIVNLAQAAVPTSITVQGRLTDTTGAPLPAGNKTLTFTIFDDQIGGSQIWPAGPGEIQTVASDAAGLWTTRIGALDPLSNQVFADSSRWLEITVDDGINPPLTLPRVQLVTGAFSFRVATVDGASGGHISSKVAIGPGNTNSGADAFVAGSGNAADGDYATIGGGASNMASGNYAVIGGGGSTTSSDGNTASGFASVAGGGRHNAAGGDYGVVAGGYYNTTSNNNTFVGGGIANSASGNGATVAGGFTSTASGSQATVGGGGANLASGIGSTIAGGNNNVAADSMAFVGGGKYNKARGKYSVVAGGGGTSDADSNSATGYGATIGGGRGNASSGLNSVVAGGRANIASGKYSTVGGGVVNLAEDTAATVAGGYINRAKGVESFIGGGRDNTATGAFSTIGGGLWNLAEDTSATCSGGRNNVARGPYSVIAGGGGAAGYDDHNEAYGHHAAIGGGQQNIANGVGGAVPGGEDNTANGICSFAAGRHAKAYFDGSFVWADNSDSDFTATAYNQLSARATGGVRFVVDIDGSGNPTWTAELVSGGSWTYTSDSTLKENFEPVDGSELLNKLADIPVSEWNAKSQDDAIKHIGPMAQDFYAAFGLGRSDRSITSSDVNGIALAAIQELDKRTQRIEELESELAELRQLVNELSEHASEQ